MEESIKMSFKKNFNKKIAAAVTAVVMMLGASGCGENSTWIAKYNDQTVNAGVYLFYQSQAYEDAMNKLKKDNEDLDVSDLKAVKNLQIDGKSVSDWVKEQAMENIRIFCAVNEKFDEYELSIDEADRDQIKQMTDNWEMIDQMYNFSGEGIGKESLVAIQEFQLKQDKVFEHIYGKDGIEAYSDNEIQDYLAGNKARVKMITMDLKDTEGEELDDAGKKEIRTMAEDFVKRANKGENFNKLKDEYDDYIEKKKAEAEAENAETTAAETTAETTAAEEEKTGTAPAADGTAEAAVTTAAGESAPAETTSAPSETTAAPEEGTKAPDSTDVSSVTETTDVTGTDEKDDEDTDTDPYKNESIIDKGSEDDGFNPSEAVNNFIFTECYEGKDVKQIEDKDNLKIYIIQRLDILERKDLYDDDHRLDLLWEILEDTFKEKALGWVGEDALTKNSAAFSRYEPFKQKKRQVEMSEEAAKKK